MLFKTYIVFGGLFCFYLYTLWFPQKQFQNKYFFGFGLCLDSLALAFIMQFSNLPTSWVLFMYMLHLGLTGILFHHSGVLYLACLSSLLFNGIEISKHLQAGTEPYWILSSMIFYHVSFFALAKTSIYVGKALRQLMRSFKQAHIALHQIRGFNQWILQNIPAGLITCDARGHIVQTNEMTSNILGLSKKVLMGNPLQNFFPSLRKRQQKLLREKASQSFFDEEISLPLKKGKPLALRCHLSLAIEKESRQEAFILIFEDQTPFREMEKKVRSAEKLASIGKLAANMAHEIRNPLASISGCVEMLKEGITQNNGENTEGGHLMPIITREVDRLNRLLSDFLSYARPEDTFSDKKKTMNMRPLIKETLLLLLNHEGNHHEGNSVSVYEKIPQRQTQTQTQAQKQKQVKVLWKDELKGQSILVQGHGDSLKQVLLNILINAYEAMTLDKNTPSPQISLTLCQEGAFFCLKIKDNGPGIPLEVQEKIFEPFYSTKTKGSGLGLSIAYQMMEYHGGSLSLNTPTEQDQVEQDQVEQREEGERGTEFILKLPALFKKEVLNPEKEL